MSGSCCLGARTYCRRATETRSTFVRTSVGEKVGFHHFRIIGEARAKIKVTHLQVLPICLARFERCSKSRRADLETSKRSLVPRMILEQNSFRGYCEQRRNCFNVPVALVRLLVMLKKLFLLPVDDVDGHNDGHSVALQ
jgi:hypothetical protein